MSLNLKIISATSILFCSLMTHAADVDKNFITTVLNSSNCQLEMSFRDEFSSAIDRLEKINPKLADHIRSESYKKALTLVCDLDENSNTIYFQAQDQTIHLRKKASSDWKTPASFFHEFLHFVGVQIDEAYHNSPRMENIVEVDNVYACHMAVFPKIMEFVKMDSSRLEAALDRCAKATVE